MAKTFSDLPKFKKIEAALRSACNARRTAVTEIDSMMTDRRTAAEKSLLQALRDESVKLQEAARAPIKLIIDSLGRNGLD